MDAVLMQEVPTAERDKTKKLLKRAVAAWWLPGHPGWAIWPVDTQQFMQDAATPVGHFLASWHRFVQLCCFI